MMQTQSHRVQCWASVSLRTLGLTGTIFETFQSLARICEKTLSIKNNFMCCYPTVDEVPTPSVQAVVNERR